MSLFKARTITDTLNNAFNFSLSWLSKNRLSFFTLQSIFQSCVGLPSLLSWHRTCACGQPKAIILICWKTAPSLWYVQQKHDNLKKGGMGSFIFQFRILLRSWQHLPKPTCIYIPKQTGIGRCDDELHHSTQPQHVLGMYEKKCEEEVNSLQGI